VKWILILTMGMADGPTSSGSVGLMMDEATCKVAGEGMSRLLQEVNPGLTVRWTCLPAELGATS
jgi:hypothetical protein